MERPQRTIYFNDARHFFLFVFEPPMTIEDAWRPVDEVAGTGVNTLVYGIARADGLFFPTKTGKLFCSHLDDIENSIYWKVRENILSLQERGLDLLQVLADRAHEKRMEFFTSFRMGTYEGVGSPSSDPNVGGRGLADPDAREKQYRVFEEIATYNIEGIELDFGGSPGGMPPVLVEDDISTHSSVLTDHVRRISEMVRLQGKQVGLRIPCVEKVCDSQGFEIRTWLQEGLIDYVVPMMYANLRIDTQMPIGWIVEASNDADVPVYGMLQPFFEDGYPNHGYYEHFTPELMRAAASNFLTKGVDGLYTWFLDWPLGSAERAMLTEIADPSLMIEADKQYRLPRREQRSAEFGYGATLPIDIPKADTKDRRKIPIQISDDPVGNSNRIQKITLRIRIRNTVSADRYSILLNGQSLSEEPTRRTSGAFVRIPVSPHRIEHYSSQWLEIDLNSVRPTQGSNVIEISLDNRPPKLGGGVTIDDLEINIEFDQFG